jgi:outer membrane immunogenic protein
MRLFRLRIMAGAGALVLAAVGQAAAADIPVAPVVKAPVRVATPSWYGFYIGVHGGYGWGRGSVDASPDAIYAPFFALSGIPTSAAGNPKGFIGGVTWGSNYQFNRLVVGTDSDFSYTDIKSSQSFTGAVGVLPFSATVDQKLKWFGTTKLRAGLLVTDNILLYATGGLANGRVSSHSAATINIAGGCIVPGPCPSGGVEKDKWGWALGGGIEFADGPWQWRVEYLHYDLGTLSYSVFDPLQPGVILASTKVNGDMVKGALTYRFNWTPWDLIFGRN